MTDDELTRIAALQESGYPGEDREVAWIEALTDARALRAEVARLRAENAAEDCAGDDQLVVYVSGPYTAPTPAGIAANINAARDAAEDLWRAGIAVICPHLNTAWFPEDEGIDYVAGDLAFLSRLTPGHDVIHMLPRWQDSEGACRELRFAVRHGLLVEFADRAEVVDPAEWAAEPEE